jgi:hypothetical protein
MLVDDGSSIGSDGARFNFICRASGQNFAKVKTRVGAVNDLERVAIVPAMDQ